MHGSFDNAREPRGHSAAVGACTGDFVFGPMLGYFVGAYAIRTADGFIGYGKVFRHRPHSPFEGEALAKVSSDTAASHGEAMQSILRPALECIRRLPALAIPPLHRPARRSAGARDEAGHTVIDHRQHAEVDIAC